MAPRSFWVELQTIELLAEKLAQMFDKIKLLNEKTWKMEDNQINDWMKMFNTICTLPLSKLPLTRFIHHTIVNGNASLSSLAQTQQWGMAFLDF